METARNESAKKSYFVPLIIVLVLIILVLLFLISPLSDLLFPPDTEPTLVLTVVESSGPDPATELYRIVVEAEVEGKPEPQVTFNRNDGVGEMQENQTLLLLGEGDIFLLKAVSANTQGTAEAELELYAGITVGTATGPTGPTDPPDSDDANPDPDDGGGDGEDEAAPPPAGDDDSGSGNQSPSIVDISIYAESIIDRLSESFPILYEERRHIFSVLIEDNDDDDIELEIEASHGAVVNTGEGMWDESRPPNTRFKTFTWQSPANPPGNLEPLNVSLTVSAFDPAGASDRKTIRIALLPEADADGGDPGEIRRVRSGIASVAASADLSGSVTSVGDIILGDVMVGDNLLNRQFKGFLNFYLGTIRDQIKGAAGDGDYTITDVRLVFSNINKVGNPESLATMVDFKVAPYGSSLVAADFAPGGKHIFNRSTATFNTAGGQPLVLSSSTFKTELINYINVPSKTMQIKLGLNSATNNNNADDFFRFHCSTVNLVVNFEY
jgi:hypothetical protein